MSDTKRQTPTRFKIFAGEEFTKLEYEMDAWAAGDIDGMRIRVKRTQLAAAGTRMEITEERRQNIPVTDLCTRVFILVSYELEPYADGKPTQDQSLDEYSLLSEYEMSLVTLGNTMAATESYRARTGVKMESAERMVETAMKRLPCEDCGHVHRGPEHGPERQAVVDIKKK